VPGIIYTQRQDARDARRARLQGRNSVVIRNGVLMSQSPPMTPLQTRALQRIFALVPGFASPTEAEEVVTSCGYNASVSYGHMRKAGATHNEAFEVVDIGSPSISLRYGELREWGFNHPDALARARDYAI